MDPGAIAFAVAGLLARKALEAAGGKAGGGAWTALGRITDAIRARFRGDQDVTETLARLETRPTSQARTQELAEVLQPRLEADRGFAAELTRLIDQAKVEPQTAAFVPMVQGNAL